MTSVSPWPAVRRALVLTVAALLLCGRPLEAAPAGAIDSPLARFDAANAAYKDQKYDEALQEYEALIRDGARDPALYYNAGCALAQLGQKGRAVAMFDRALKLRPRFREAHENLARVRPRGSDGSIFFLFVPFRALFRSMTAEEFFLVCVVAYWLLAFGATGWILSRPGRIRTVSRALAWASLAALLFFGPYFLLRERADRRSEAVVIVDKALSRSGPSEKYLELDQLSEGVKVGVLSPPQDGWVKIQLPEGRIVFLPEQDIEAI